MPPIDLPSPIRLWVRAERRQVEHFEAGPWHVEVGLDTWWCGRRAGTRFLLRRLRGYQPIGAKLCVECQLALAEGRPREVRMRGGRP